MVPAATVLVPTHDHGPTLLRSVPTALEQTVDDLEVFIVGDGVTDEARGVIEDLLRRDDRIRFFDNPKGEHRGEAHRHAALEHARGEIVCYLTDDDLWLPEHVETMRDLLTEADFAHTLPIHATDEGGPAGWSGDLAIPFFRRLILDGTNFIPFPCGAHTLAIYREVAGWSPRPGSPYTDLAMWQQLLEHPGCRAVTGTRPTVVYFHERAGVATSDRLPELDRWVERIADPDRRARLQEESLDLVYRDRAHLLASLLEVEGDEVPDELVFTTYQMTLDRRFHDRRKRAFAETRRMLLASVEERWRARLEEREERIRELEDAVARVEDQREELQRSLDLVTGSRTWRLRERLLRIPGLARRVRR